MFSCLYENGYIKSCYIKVTVLKSFELQETRHNVIAFKTFGMHHMFSYENLVINSKKAKSLQVFSFPELQQPSKHIYKIIPDTQIYKISM